MILNIDRSNLITQQILLKYQEDVVTGLENAPRAFMGLLQGENFGKLIIKVSDALTTN